jgi:hypothetical protein
LRRRIANPSRMFSPSRTMFDAPAISSMPCTVMKGRVEIALPRLHRQEDRARHEHEDARRRDDLHARLLARDDRALPFRAEREAGAAGRRHRRDQHGKPVKDGRLHRGDLLRRAEQLAGDGRRPEVEDGQQRDCAGNGVDSFFMSASI